MIAALALIGLAFSASVPPPAPIPDGFVPVVDDLRAIVVAVPEAWADVDTEPAMVDGAPRPYIAASPDINTFLSSFEAPGVMFASLAYVADPAPLVDQFGLVGGCETIELTSYEDPVFVGVAQVGTNCGPRGMRWHMVVASPPDQAFTAVIQVQVDASDDLSLQTVLLTFNTATR